MVLYRYQEEKKTVSLSVGEMSMIDEKKVIKKLQSRIDDFVLKHPDRKDSEAVETIREFIHLLEEEAKEQGSERDG